MKLTTKTNIENKTKSVSKSVSRTKKRKVIKPYKINVYAKNMRYMESNNDNGNSSYDMNKDKYKILLSKLTESLGENQWLMYSKEKYKPIKHIDIHNNNDSKLYDYRGSKPKGSYYSKGSWLFHSDNCCKLDKEIIFIEVDYKTIYRITGKEPFKSPIKNSIYINTLSNFMNKYGEKFGKDKCKPYVDCYEYDTEDECNNPKNSCVWDPNKPHIFIKNKKGKCIVSNSCSQFTTEKKCKNTKKYNCIYNYSYKHINWGDLYKNYNGFAIYPFPEYEMLTGKKYRKEFFALYGYDVETLVLWDHTPVIKHHNFGTIKDILKESGLTDTDITDIKDKEDLTYFYENFIQQLIKKINKINNK